MSAPDITLELLHSPNSYSEKQIRQALKVAGGMPAHRVRFVLLEPPQNS